jgi:thiamine-phosphate diphosphorylase
VLAVAGLYAIVDVPVAGDLAPADALGAVLAGGCRCVQLRAKRSPTRERLELARVFGPMCAAADGSLWIDDDIEVAVAGIPGVTGVHLGQEDLSAAPDGWRDRLHRAGAGLGLSTHDLAQLRRAHALAPDYVGFGPVYPTRGKANPDPVVGLEGLVRACARAVVPVVAIGGIDGERARACLGAGASAVAVIGALVAADMASIEAQTRNLHEACRDALATRGHGASEPTA